MWGEDHVSGTRDAGKQNKTISPAKIPVSAHQSIKCMIHLEHTLLLHR